MVWFGIDKQTFSQLYWVENSVLFKNQNRKHKVTKTQNRTEKFYIKVWKSRVLNFVSEEETCWCFISWQSNKKTKITNIDSWKKRKVSKVRMDLQVRLQGVPTSFRQGFSKKIAKYYEMRKNSWKFVYILASSAELTSIWRIFWQKISKF